MADVLVLGFGNDLRRDDGAGRRVAEAVAAAALPGVDARSVHQLAPEHAADLAGRRRVVFVDARAVDAAGAGAVEVGRVDAAATGWRLTHHLGPRELLALAALLGGRPGEAFVVTVPARDLGLGTSLSPATAAAVEEAVRRVAALCRAGTRA